MPFWHLRRFERNKNNETTIMRQLKITKSITSRDSQSLDKYLQEIGREQLLTVEEEVELSQRIRKGDRQALDTLVKSNLRFVVSVAKQYQNQGLTLPDLINEGNVGLIKAAEKFDETRGFKFISYAVWWIRQTILQALAEQSRIVRLPLNQVSAVNKISKAITKFEQEFERKPSPEELAELVNEVPEKINDSLRASGRHVSVDAPFVEGEDNSPLDVMENTDAPAADHTLISESLQMEISRALEILNERERDIIEMSFGISQPEMTLEEILNDPTIEAVTVETEEIHLTKYAIMAAEHGKMIHMEKPEAVEKFCKGIQFGAPVDSFVTPVPWAMPGYDCPVIMAAGAFVQGSSIELSADGPIREPYAVYFQGGLTWYHAKLGILMSLQKMVDAGLVNI